MNRFRRGQQQYRITGHDLLVAVFGDREKSADCNTGIKNDPDVVIFNSRADNLGADGIGRICLPRPSPDSVQIFRKVGTREAHAISKIVVALVGRLEDGEIAQYRLGAGSVAPVPVRLTAGEEAVTGRAADMETADLAGRLAADSVEPIDDVRSTAAYRRFALERVVRRLTLNLTDS